MNDDIKAHIASLEAERTVVFGTQGGAPPDLLIICQSCTFAVHEQVMAPKVGFIRNAMRVDMKEKQERKIVTSEYDPFVVQALIHAAYTGIYFDEGSNDRAQDPPATFNAKVYALAEEWHFMSLKELACRNYQRRILLSQRWCVDTAAAALNLGWCEDIAESIAVVYTSTPANDRDLRDFIVTVASTRWSTWAKESTFQEALDTVPGFGADVARELAERLEKKT